MNKYYFYLEGDNQKGPLSLDHLKTVNIKRDTLVWTEGMDEWKSAKEVEEFKFLFASHLPPPPLLKKNIMEESGIENTGQGQTAFVNKVEQKTNGAGIAGFVLALLTVPIVFMQIPVGLLLWLLAFILSMIGMFKEPKGFAIAGLIICVVIFLIDQLFLADNPLFF